jgi:hypothetical protein
MIQGTRVGRSVKCRRGRGETFSRAWPCTVINESFISPEICMSESLCPISGWGSLSTAVSYIWEMTPNHRVAVLTNRWFEDTTPQPDKNYWMRLKFNVASWCIREFREDGSDVAATSCAITAPWGYSAHRLRTVIGEAGYSSWRYNLFRCFEWLLPGTPQLS